MPRVDVIIPAYNGARYLSLAIESVIAQTFEDWMIVLVDDGSTDNIDDVARPFVDRLGSRLKYIKQTNSGVSAARNRGIRDSSAEFLALIDSDDIWLPTRLADSVRAFEGRPEVGLSYSFVSLIDENGQIFKTFDVPQKHAEGRIARYIYTREVQLPSPAITVRRSCVEEVGGFDESLRVTEDRDLWLRIAFRYEVAFVPKVLAYYRSSSGSATTDPNRMLMSQLQFIEKHHGAPGCGFSARQIALSGIYRQRAEAFGLRREYRHALGSAAHAVVSYPFDLRNLRTACSLLLRSIGLIR